MHFYKKRDIMVIPSVMLLCVPEVIHMKYENPTCEIVLLDSVAFLDASVDITKVSENDTPFISYPNF